MEVEVQEARHTAVCSLPRLVGAWQLCGLARWSCCICLCIFVGPNFPLLQRAEALRLATQRLHDS